MNAETVIAAILVFILLTTYKKPKPSDIPFSQKIAMAGTWAEAEFTNDAILMGVPSLQLKSYDRGKPIPTPLFHSEMYSEPRARALRRMGIHVVNVDLGKELPDQYVSRSPYETVMDRLELTHWVV